MHVILVSIGLIIFTAGAVYIRQSRVDTTLDISDKTTENYETSPEPSATNTPTVQPTNTIAYKEPVATNTPQPTSTSAPTQPAQNTTTYHYPNARVVASSNSSLRLESSDDPGTITDWYKSRIKEQNMNVRSFVTTNSNGEILNKLGAANGTSEVMITIRKSASETVTTIEVEH